MKKLIKKLIIFIIICGVIGSGLDLYVVGTTRGNVVGSSAELSIEDPDCILILGCGIKDDNTPSDMLKDRLDTGYELYTSGMAQKILVSGDNGQEGYNEIHVMLHYLLDKGVPEEDLFCDHAGFSTYDSVHRAQSIFGVSKMVIVTQKYHQYRALFIADQLGITAQGACADVRSYRGQVFRECREILARDKDCVKSWLRLGPKYGGEKIPLDGDSKASWEESELN